MRRIIWTTAVTALLVLSFAILKGGETSLAAGDIKTYEIKIDNFSFGPMHLTVPIGSTVTWVNQDDVPHTVVSVEGKVFKSPALDTDERFSYTFTKAGTYAYFCSVHPKMTAMVIVQ